MALIKIINIYYLVRKLGTQQGCSGHNLLRIHVSFIGMEVCDLVCNAGGGGGYDNS